MINNFHTSVPNYTTADISSIVSVFGKPNVADIEVETYIGNYFGNQVNIGGTLFYCYKLRSSSQLTLDSFPVIMIYEATDSVGRNYVQVMSRGRNMTNIGYMINIGEGKAVNSNFLYEPYIIYKAGKYCAVAEEIAVKRYYRHIISIVGDNSTFMPYENVYESKKIGVTFNLKSVIANSISFSLIDNSNFTYSGFLEIKNGATLTTDFPSANRDNCYFTQINRSIDISALFVDLTVKWTVHIADWDNKTYSISHISDNFTAYVGKPLGDDFLKTHRLIYTTSNSYKTIVSEVQKTLESSRINSTNIKENSININYDLTGITLTDKTSIDYTCPTKPITLYSDNRKYKNISFKKNYQYDDILSYDNFLSANGNNCLTYSDDTTIDLVNVGYHKLPEFTAEVANGTTLTADVIGNDGKFSVRYTLDTTDFGLLNYLFQCSVSGGNNIHSVEFESGGNLYLNKNDTLVLNDNTKLFLKNSGNEVIKIIRGTDFGSDENIILDARFGKAAAEVFEKNNTEVELKITAYDHEFIIIAVCNDYNDFKIVQLPTKNLYYIESSFPYFDLETAGFEASIKHRIYDNSGNYTDKTESLSASDIDFVVGNVNDKEDSFCAVTCNYKDAFNQIHSTTFKVTTVVIRIINIGLGDITINQKFWIDIDNRFVLPDNLKIVGTYSDSSRKNTIFTDVELTDNFNFYTDEGLKTQIYVNESTISDDRISRIYFCLKDDSKVKGHYEIGWQANRLIGLTLASSMSFILGNRFRKENFKIKATYLNGDENSDYKEYSFKNTELIMHKCDVVLEDNVAHDTFIIDRVGESKINWVNPGIKEARIELNNAPIYFINSIDSINMSRVFITISYIDADYVQKVIFQNSDILVDNEKFYVNYEDDNMPENYICDGKTVIMYDMPTDAIERQVILKLNYKDVFANSIKASLLSVIVANLTDITGISIKNLKTTYKVGEVFLGQDDPSEVNILYKVPNEPATRMLPMKLSSGNALLNIYPLKGTKFSTINRNQEVTITSVTDGNINLKYNISVSSEYEYSSTKTHNIVTVLSKNFSDINNCDIKTNYDGIYLLVDIENTIIENNKRIWNPDRGQMTIENVYGYLDDLFDGNKLARVILFKDYISPVDGRSNMIVKFPCYSKENSDLINKCHFGILFGSNNATNRLFLSGNSDVPNADWHSIAVNNTNVEGERMKDSGNFSYISDASIMYYGETDNKIVGYDIVSNDKLLVIKDKSDKEKTIYFRTPTMVTQFDSTGNVVTDTSGTALCEEEFALVKGNNATAGINPRAVINFNGDSLFVDSDNHLVGLDIEGVIGDSQRYANTRSIYIDNKLKDLDLSETFLWTDNKYLFMPIKNFGTFITHFQAITNNQYEWWLVNDKNPTAFIEMDNTVYFGNDSGDFYKISKNSFVDKEKIFLDSSSNLITHIEPYGNTVTIADSVIKMLDPTKHYSIKITPTTKSSNEYVYCYLGSAINSLTSLPDFYIHQKNIEVINSEIESRIRENQNVYLNYAINNCGINTTDPDTFIIGEPYRLKIDPDNTSCYFLMRFNSADQQWQKIENLSQLYSCTLCYRIEGEYQIINIKDTATLDNFQISEDGKTPIDIVLYANQTVESPFEMEIIREENVVAFYITCPYTMGNLNYFKTIWSYTLTNDTNISGEIDLSYASNKVPNDDSRSLAVVCTNQDLGNVTKDSLQIDFNDLDFTRIDFDKVVVPRTYTIQRTLPMQKFICFAFKNFSNTNAVLSSMTITYTIPYSSYGKD